MALAEKPAVAEDIMSFGGQADVAARLNYNVPLPGSYRGRRILRLEGLDMDDDDWKDAAPQAGVDAAAAISLQQVGEGGTFTYAADAAVELWFRAARANGIRGDKLAELERWTSSPRGSSALRQVATGGAGVYGTRGGYEGGGSRPMYGRERPGGEIELTPDPTGPEGSPPELYKYLLVYLEKLNQGRLAFPQSDWAGEATTTGDTGGAGGAVQAKPALFLVEIYGLSSFPGDYGLGRTVKTFTLLPGEEVTIRMRTWRSSEQSRKDSSSIFDSYSTESTDRFQSAVQRETTDKRTQSSKEEWHVEANVSASWGWGDADVSGGGSGEYHGGREQFAKQVNDTSQEHAAQASSKRDTTVTSSTESIERREDEETVERVIRNVNMRRTLNFVFRELNQEYLTKVHLIEVKVAFTNGRPGSWREVPLSGLRGLLADVLEANKVDEIASAILGLVGVVFDKDDDPVSVLETLEMEADGSDWDKTTPAARQPDGTYAPPRTDFIYRFRRTPLGQGGDKFTVAGVVLKEDSIVLRTDSVVVEALLGQADALDEYAMLSQKADAEAKELANKRAAIVNDGLQNIADGEKRAAAYADIVQNDGAVRLELENVE